MSGKSKFEEQLAALDGLRRQPPELRLEPLRKALAHRNNFVVAKAADLSREFQLNQLTAELLTAFDHFFSDPIKTDPQCWAKNSLSRTLAAFEYPEAGVFLRGTKHMQLEPVWGGRSDTAGTLRGTCALALVQCRSLTESDLLAHLLELFADQDKSVRVEIARALEQVGSSSASLLLRLKAILGDDEPEVLGACYGAILRTEGNAAIPWLSRFLASSDDAAAEAALALSATHSPPALAVLQNSFAHASDPWFRSVLLSAIALTRQDSAVEFLLDLVRTESLQAELAIEAILRSVPSPEVIDRLEQLVRSTPRLAKSFAVHRAAARA
jgi:HEAT repeat protein